MPPGGQADPSYFRRCIRCVAQRIFKSGGRYAKQVKGIDCDRPTRRWWLRACEASMEEGSSDKSTVDGEFALDLPQSAV